MYLGITFLQKDTRQPQKYRRFFCRKYRKQYIYRFEVLYKNIINYTLSPDEEETDVNTLTPEIFLRLAACRIHVYRIHI